MDKSTLSRRHFLFTAGALSLGFGGLPRLLEQVALATGGAPLDPRIGFGPLRADAHGLLDLPEGFEYRVISRMGQVMDDGLLVPGRPDGMEAYPGPGGLTIVVRNHEIGTMSRHRHPPLMGAFGPNFELLERVDRDLVYDLGGGRPPLGGVSTFVYDTQRNRVERQFLSLAGTAINCAGGRTPWGSWISCEETEQRANPRHGFEKHHGYNFEIPATAEPTLVEPRPLLAMGRFQHEAVCVDPATGIVYQTEDLSDGLIYRFIPRVNGRLDLGGTLQAMAIRGEPSLDTRNWSSDPGWASPASGAPRRTVRVGEILDVEWIDVDDIDSPNDDLRYRGFEAGAARFARGEGMYWGHDSAYIVCTNGGREARAGLALCPQPLRGSRRRGEVPRASGTVRRAQRRVGRRHARQRVRRAQRRSDPLHGQRPRELPRRGDAARRVVQDRPRGDGLERVRGRVLQPRRLDHVREHPGPWADRRGAGPLAGVIQPAARAASLCSCGARSSASMKSSRCPSSTVCGLPISCPVRWSFTRLS